MTHQLERIYVIDGLGGIEIGSLERGDMTVKITYSKELRDALKPIMRHGERSWFNEQYKNWVVFERFRDVILTELECLGGIERVK